MRTLVKQLLDQDISRRGFVKELAALGVSLSSAQALLNSISPAVAAETTEAGLAKEVTGNGPELLAESLMAAGVTNIFHGCGGGINKISMPLLRDRNSRIFWRRTKVNAWQWRRDITLLLGN